MLYAARIGDCRTCARRFECQESRDTAKPRRVSAVFWPVPATQALSSALLAASHQAPLTMPKPIPHFPVLMQDWTRCQIRRNWLKVVRSETVVVVMGPPSSPEPMTGTKEQVMTRAQRAHWRLSWHERLVRNARLHCLSPDAHSPRPSCHVCQRLWICSPRSRVNAPQRDFHLPLTDEILAFPRSIIDTRLFILFSLFFQGFQFCLLACSSLRIAWASDH